MLRRIFGYGGLALLLLVITLPWWLPLGRFVPEIEGRASAALGRPVTVGGLSLRLLPAPQAVLRDVRVGEEPLLVLPEVRVVPRLSTLWGPPRVIERVSVIAPRIDTQVLQALGGLGQGGAPAQPAVVHVEQVVIEDATLQWPGGTLAGLDAQVRLGPGHGLVEARLSHDQGRLRLTVTPAPRGYALRLEGRDWTLPVGPALRFDNLQASALAGNEDLAVDAIKAGLYGGEITASATLRWKSGVRLNGRFAAARIDLEPLLRVVRPGTRLGGRLTSKGEFGAVAKTFASLSKQLAVGADFRIEQGILRGVDLAGAVKRLVGAAGKPADTAFDRLDGHVESGVKGTRLSKLEIESGLLRADGEIFVGADKAVDGEARVALKGTASLVGTPTLIIDGTTDEPRVYPSKGVLAGAAVGTAVLGPGLGTSLGMKAGELARKLFSGERPPAPQTRPTPGR